MSFLLNDSCVYRDDETGEGDADACGLVVSMSHIHMPEGGVYLLFLGETENGPQGAFRLGTRSATPAPRRSSAA